MRNWETDSSFPCRLKFKFKKGSVPPVMPLEFIGCIGGCDEMLKELLDLKYLHRSSQPASSTPQPGHHLQANHSLNRASSETRQARGTSNLARGHLLSINSSRTPRAAPAAAADDGNAVVCNCGSEALLLTVRKEGPNKGRQFYKCSSSTCNFFLWADEQPQDRSSTLLQPTAGTAPAGLQRPGGGREALGSSSSDAGGGIVCRCEEPVVTRTVQKDGPNKGRQFHTCPKPREQQCGFFQWADENVAPGMAGLGAHTGDGGCS